MKRLLCSVLVGLPMVLSAYTVPPDVIAGPDTSKEPTTGLPMEVTSKKTGHVFRIVVGEFTMGSDKGDDDEKPPHKVTLSPFYLGIAPISNSQYEQMDPGHERGDYSQGADDPATNVTWAQANQFANYISEQENAEGKYVIPTEAVWEKAAKEKSSGIYPWGDDLTDADKHFYDKKKATSVTSNIRGELKFYHTTGNVFCWCSDWYASDYYQKSPGADPTGAENGKARVLRGGRWYLYGKSLRSSDRWYNYPETKSEFIGLRIGRVADGITGDDPPPAP